MHTAYQSTIENYAAGEIVDNDVNAWWTVDDVDFPLTRMTIMMMDTGTGWWQIVSFALIYSKVGEENVHIVDRVFSKIMLRVSGFNSRAVQNFYVVEVFSTEIIFYLPHDTWMQQRSTEKLLTVIHPRTYIFILVFDNVNMSNWSNWRLKQMILLMYALPSWLIKCSTFQSGSKKVASYHYQVHHPIETCKIEASSLCGTYVVWPVHSVNFINVVQRRPSTHQTGLSTTADESLNWINLDYLPLNGINLLKQDAMRFYGKVF